MSGAAGACYHCGEPLPPGCELTVNIGGAARPMCCRGCQAVAQAIVDNGLADYYRNRTALPGRGHEVLPAELESLKLYDHPRVQQSFVLDAGPHRREALLILEGITCAACVWLNERHLLKLPGVKAVHVNYSSHRARIAWDEREISLSQILAAIQTLGYNAHPYDAHSAAARREQERKRELRRIAVAGIAAAQVMMLAVALYAGDWHGMDAATRELLRWASLVLTLPVMGYAALPFFASARAALRARQVNMDVPVALALTGAFFGSVIHTVQGEGHVYYDAVTMFALFLLGTRFLERGARERAAEAAENLLKLAPATAVRLEADGPRIVPVFELSAGDCIQVKPGEAIAADGVVESGESGVDESLLTGESRPVPKRVASKVIAGSVNIDGPLVVRVTEVGERTVLAGIVRLLDQALAQKPRLAQWADRVAGPFTWLLLAFTVLVGLTWYAVAPERAFEIVLAVLVVTCPCALSLAAPAAMAAAGSHLLQRGILITRGHALETLARVTHVVFDKTGTLTQGKPALQATTPLAELDAPACLQLAASLEQASEHPLAASFRAATRELALQPVTDPRNEPGRGVSGTIAGKRYTLGRAERGDHDDAFVPPGASPVWLAEGDRVLARFVLADPLRNDAGELIQALRAEGLQLGILSGDDRAAVEHVAQALAITDARSGQRPADKLAAIQALQQQGAIVAMVGDGVNDAPVLAQAQVSIAMGGGTDVARASSDVVLLSDRLPAVAEALRVARAAVAVMRQNVVWAIAYNLAALPLAALGYVSPWLAALGMSASSLIVVVNALRLR